jgi:predicted dehydrogenase
VSNLQLVAACDVDAARRDRLRARFAIPIVYDDPRTMLEREQPDIVIVGTPPALHAEHCLLGLEYGAHIFCEKPFVEQIEQGRAVVAAAERAQRQIAVNNQYRYMPIYRETARRLAAGEFGRLYYLHAWQQMYHPPTMESNWRATLSQATLFEFGTHVLDLLLYFFDARPVAITAQMPYVHANIAADMLDLVQMRFPGERAATITLNRLSRAPERYLEMRLECEEASVRISLGGVAYARLGWSRARKRPTWGAACARGGEARVERDGRSERIALEWRDGFAPATAIHLAEFVCSIDAGREPTNSARHALTLLEIVHAGYESARTGQTIPLVWN